MSMAQNLYARVEGGMIVEGPWMIAADTPQTPEGWADLTDAVGVVQVGAVLVGSVWTMAASPPAPPPATVTNFQIRAALRMLPAPPGYPGTMRDIVDTALKARGGDALDAWEYANEVNRAGPLVQQMAAAFGFSEAQLDALFTAASTISA